MKTLQGILVLLVLAAGGIYAILLTGSDSPAGEQAQLRINVPDPRPMSAQIEDWSKYKESTSIIVGGLGDCGTNLVFDALYSQANSGSRKVLRLNGELDLVITPNYLNLRTDQFVRFNSDSTAICAAGNVYPFWAYEDKLLWKGVCSTGLMPDPGTSEYEEFQKCQAAEDAVANYFEDK